MERNQQFNLDFLKKVLTETCFKIGVGVGSMFVGYYMVSGKFRPCLDFYHIVKTTASSMA